MSALDESKELLYVVRALDVLMSSGIGLEAGLTNIARGGYGQISKDFSSVMDGVRKGRPLEGELRRLMQSAHTDGYKRLLNTMINNVTQNTDIIQTLSKLGERLEEERTESVKAYIEELGGVPETLLSLGMIGPIILSILGLAPQLMGDLGSFMAMPDPAVINGVVTMGLVLTLVGMAMTGIKAHTKDPGL